LGWTQTLNGGTVKYLLASSKCSNGSTNYPTCNTGTWTFKDSAGATQTDCSGTDCYTATGDGAKTQAINAVHNGDQYILYKAFFTAPSGNANTPVLNDITLNYSYYPTANQTVLSSKFDTGDAYSSMGNITWTKSGTGTVKFQMRTAADATALGSALWCGPTACDVIPGGGTSDFYVTNTGNTINSVQRDNSGDRWFQYAAFLVSTDGVNAPTLSDVTVTYNFNIPPAISSVGYTQNADGTVSVPYTLTETIDGTGTINHTGAYASLFFSPDSALELPVGGLDNIETGTITLVNPNNAPIPTQGTMLVDKELITFNSGSGNSITIMNRHVAFDAPSSTYPTVAATHTIANTKVYFKATRKTDGADLSQIISGLTAVNPGTTNVANNSFAWDPKNEPYAGLNTKKLTNLIFKVAAHDADPLNLNTIGSALGSAQTLDLQAPTIASVVTTV
jgi:hypothetical protein